MATPDVQFNHPGTSIRTIASTVTLLAISLTAVAPARAQGCSQGPAVGRVALLAGGFAAAQAAIIVIRHDDWWQTPARGFHIVSGGSPSKGQDALIHGAIAYHVSQIGALAWDWTCVSRDAAAWLGAALGLAVGLPKEIGDGLHEDKGFSLDDFGAGTIGALLPALHRTVPASRIIRLKFSYWPSAEFSNRSDGLPQLENDYAGQRYFLAVTPGRLPGGAGSWPDWLGIALGHSVPQWASAPPTHQWYVAVDLQLRAIPIRATWWHTVATVLDQVHFPLPGIRINQGEVEFGLF